MFSFLCYSGHVPLCNQALVFINLLCLSDHQVNVPIYKDQSPHQQGLPYLVCADESQWIWIEEYLISLCIVTVWGILGWAQKWAKKSNLKFNFLYLDGLCKCTGLDLSLQLTGAQYSYPTLNCFHWNSFWDVKFYLAATMSMISKDKPEGGTSTGLTRHGLLGLAHKCY